MAAVTSAAPAVSTAAQKVPPPPACTVGARKVWGTGANKLTGLATTKLEGDRIAVGLALGLDPHVLVIEPSGEARLLRVSVGKATAVGKPPKADEGTRKLFRVTPHKVDGDKAFAFLDYHDEYKSKRRRVACGPSDTDETWIHFDDVPWLDRPEKPTGDERKKLLSGHHYDDGRAEEDKHGAADEKGYHELRDCRTFSDGAGQAWIVGSELEADEKEDGSLAWHATLIVDRGPKQTDVHLSEIALKGDPPSTATFEVPISHALGKDELLLATRFGATLRVGLLGADKRLRGKLASYPGFPTLPQATEDGDDVVMVLSVAKDRGNFALRGMRVSRTKLELPKALTAIDTHSGEEEHTHAAGHDDEHDHKDHSETDPTFLRDTKGRRWLSFIEGTRGRGKLTIVPIDEDFQAIGRGFAVFEDTSLASEARLVALPDGAILVVSLREGDKGVEVVTEEIRCEVVKG